MKIILIIIALAVLGGCYPSLPSWDRNGTKNDYCTALREFYENSNGETKSVASIVVSIRNAEKHGCWEWTYDSEQS